MPTCAYRGRLAPSPTGQLHFGIARTSLCAWLAARSVGGALVLRIEDLDGPRVVEGSTQTIMDDLRWLGLDWDEGPDRGGAYGPYLQSARSARYDEAVERLTRAGRVFRCSCSRAEVAAASSAPHGEPTSRYPGTCRNGPTRPGRPCSLRFAMERAPAFVDRVYGAFPEGPGDDFVIQRADGQHAYQLAVVVDDMAMGITEVVRGADLLDSTPRQIALYEALGATPPAFLHVPLVLDAHGVRLAKRHGATPIAEMRARGVSKQTILGALAHSLGLARQGEQLDAQALVARFDPARLPHEPYVLERIS